MPADQNDRYIAAYIAAYGHAHTALRSAAEIVEIREEMMAVEEASDDEVAARFLTAIGYKSINILDAVRRMRSALGIPAPLSDADRVQVALSTAEARVEELEGEVARIRAALTDLVDRCDRSELADGTSIDTLTAHVALGHIVKEPTDAR